MPTPSVCVRALHAPKRAHHGCAWDALCERRRERFGVIVLDFVFAP